MKKIKQDVKELAESLSEEETIEVIDKNKRGARAGVKSSISTSPINMNRDQNTQSEMRSERQKLEPGLKPAPYSKSRSNRNKRLTEGQNSKHFEQFRQAAPPDPLLLSNFGLSSKSQAKNYNDKDHPFEAYGDSQRVIESKRALKSKSALSRYIGESKRNNK